MENQLSQYVVNGLLKAYHNNRSDGRDGFPVWDDKVNSFLSMEFGIEADPERIEHETGTGMTVYFDWRLQVWRVY